MADVRANPGVPVIAQFAGVGTPSACAPVVVDSTTGYIYTVKTGDVVFLAAAGAGAGITLQTNGVANGSQVLLNLKNGAGMTITDDGVGGITFAATGAAPSWLRTFAMMGA